MLGTGSAFAKRYFNNNALLDAEGGTVMLDCGITGPAALHSLGRTFNDIDALLLSHIHADHIGGVEEFAFQMKFVYNRKPVLYIPEPLTNVLWENSLKGGLVQEEWTKLDDFFEVRPLREGEAAELVPGLSVEPIRTPHIAGKASYSYIVNRTFFYSADMTFQPELLAELAGRGCTVFFHDCQLKSPGIVHASLDELLTLPETMQERIWLMHYDDTKPQFEGRTGKMRFVEQHSLYTFE